MANIANEYLVKRGEQSFATIPSLFDGVRVLKIDGYTSVGEPKNIYTASWVNTQSEDYLVTDQEEIAGVVYDKVFRANKDIDITFIVSDKYATGEMDVRTIHDAFVAYMTDGALYLKSNYVNRTLRCVCLKSYKPTITKLQRPTGKNYIMGTITLHSLDERAGDDDGYVGNPYPQPSEGGGTTPAPSQIYTTQVYDVALAASQNVLNQQFAQKSRVQMSVSDSTLNITIT